MNKDYNNVPNEVLERLSSLNLDDNTILSSVKDAQEQSKVIIDSLKSDPRYDDASYSRLMASYTDVSSIIDIDEVLDNYYNSTNKLLYNIEMGTSNITGLASVFEKLDQESKDKLHSLGLLDINGNPTLTIDDRLNVSSVLDLLNSDWEYSDATFIQVDGKKYALDNYVWGVLLGENVAQEYYKQYKKGIISYDDMFEALKSFSLMARSYGLYQTVFSDGHQKDHIIENGEGKQCFTKHFFDDDEEYVYLSKLAVMATKGEVIAYNNGENGNNDYKVFDSRYSAFTTEYRSSDKEKGVLNAKMNVIDYSGNPTGEKYDISINQEIAKGFYNGGGGQPDGGSQWNLVTLAQNGYDYKSAALVPYSDSEIQEFNYDTATFNNN